MTPREAFATQAKIVDALGSPFMVRLMNLCAERLGPGTLVERRVLDWAGDAGPGADNVPLRLAGGLHALKLLGRALTQVYPPHQVDDDALWRAVKRAFMDHSDHLLAWLENAPQTNEVRRASALLPALAVLGQKRPGPVALYEVGTSGGLNLRSDMFSLSVAGGELGRAGSPVALSPDWYGPPPPFDVPKVVTRRGVDLNPLDPVNAEDELRLLAYLWPDQTDRIARTSAAIAIAAEVPADVTQGDAGDWAATVLADLPSDVTPVLFHTIALQYFPDTTRAKIDAAIAASSVPVARISMEADGGHGAALTLSIAPDAARQDLARVDFHGRWVDWSAP